MGFWNKYPYTDLTHLNLDALISIVKSLVDQVENFVSLNAIKYADPIQWSIITQYQKNTVVIDPVTGIAYISVANVPQGVLLTDTDYWTVVFDLSSFVTKTARNFTANYEADTTLTATFATSANDWLIWGDVLYHVNTNINPGDAYVVGSNLTAFSIEEILGHLEDLLTTDKSTYVAAINEVVNNIGNISNLTTHNTSNLVSAVNEINSYITDTFSSS